jgi:hypothetical protein
MLDPGRFIVLRGLEGAGPLLHVLLPFYDPLRERHFNAPESLSLCVLVVALRAVRQHAKAQLLQKLEELLQLN